MQPSARTQRLTAKLQSISLLYDLSSRLIACVSLEQAIAEILEAANALHRARAGRVQIHDALRNVFEMVAQRGFAPGSFEAVRPISADDRFASARAMRARRPVMIEDVNRDAAYGPYRSVAAGAGYRALLATPLISSGGEFVGVLSTYFPKPHKPSKREIRLTEIYARQAADIILRFRTEKALQDTEERLRLVNRELVHRVKNMLAVIQSIAGQTLRAAPTPEHFVDSFSGRLQSIGRAQALLTEAGDRGVRLNDLIKEQAIIGRDGEERIAMAGPDVLLTPQAAFNFGLVLHELATNARKYGALATEAGRVNIAWTVEAQDGQRLLKLAWLERGGPPVAPPDRKGFGTSLIQRVIDAARDTDAALHFEPEGLVCHIHLTLHDAPATDFTGQGAPSRPA